MADFVLPGQAITSESGYLRGHGAYLRSAGQQAEGESGSNGVLVSSIAGRIVRVNKLISVKPIKSRYFYRAVFLV
jgi:exosome complex component RRP4